MKRIWILLLAAVLLVSCGMENPGKSPDTQSGIADAETRSAQPEKDGSSSDESSVREETQGRETTETTGNQILVAYFSVTGNTKPLAEYAAEIIGADLYEIRPEISYTEEDIRYYTDCRADREQNDPYVRPAIAGALPDTSSYRVVMIAYPIWHGQAPRIISTFLEGVELAGVTVVPFCTSASSGIGSSDTNLHALAPDATWIKGSRFAAGTSKESIQNWIEGLDLPDTTGGNGDTIMTLTISGQTFFAELAETEAAQSFASLLPRTLQMSELNGNEKYAYLEETLPAKAERPGRIEAGDIMLYGNNCIVVFYESFGTSYSYTRIGKVKETAALKAALGKSGVSVTFTITDG